MKLKVTPTNRETVLETHDVIVSKTDLAGKITYANRTFMRICELGEPELLGIQHNVIRHPDMPRAAFKLLWDTIQAGNEYFAYVKNICKDGGFYWVMANITPDYDEKGQLVGYYSVRRRPGRKAIEVLTPIYKKMVEIESQYRPKEALVQSADYLNSLLGEHRTNYNDFIINLMRAEP